ncbi:TRANSMEMBRANE PROTEIN [Salix viminalis]|uniref:TRANSMEMBRANE PROTEIN n=1 Tax=Salix viminalis TaxID=40686 RepID=A0A9Q0NYY8_SALVM|nr:TRANSMEMBRANE PROTEIN [Salix viminalis]
MKDGAVDKRFEEVVTNSVDIQSLGSFNEVRNCLLEMNEDAVKVIVESKEDIWDNPELFGLVDEYFKSTSVKTMEFCTALGSCLERAKNSQLILQLAINQFEEEVEMKEGAVEKTLEGLQKFKAAGDPFTPQFFALYESVHEQQVSMFKKSQSLKKKLDEKLKSMKTWRRVSNVLFVSAIICFVGNWCNRYEKALEEEKGIVRSIEVGTFVTIKDMVDVRELVNKLQVEIESLLHVADFATREEDVIKRKMAVFMESIEDLAVHADKCNSDISQARTVILNRILKHADQ